MSTKEKVALVTGGSKGLGKSIAQNLAACGVTVIINYHRDQEAADAVVQTIRENGGDAFAIQADVTNEEEVDRLVGEAEQQTGRSVNIVVNNATGPQPEYSLEEVTWEDYLDQLLFTTKAPLLLTKAVIPSMKEEKWGRIINIGSEVVELGNAHFSNYVTAKSAVVGMTRSWASELGEHGITVNAVHPGFTPVERHGEVSEETKASYLKDVPLKRMGEPHDIANTVRFLSSDDASFITGQNISVNGGKTF
ncbi:SDR family NAD(P)-dependent oxidoreductase [Halobacillus sp. Nhm2S1]|uniref:SDR family NAD(P)-dependent oxidoreductase n=1 Tax=Halobacillus sp. Nhm2S1 TaxID=2866716 RepID=UPI001C73A6B7|nr:SDR family oxidoreductase [Halobacillus sp. Nhm2S1]MBX0358393.1 SDR family oxidoreductase [Halobacillus sp. Nhm2S1]